MMRRFLLIVAALVFAAPAMATVNIALTHEGGGVVRIDYAVTAGEDVRAFALDVTVDSGQTITAISNFFTGEGAGYGIFPGTFRDFINPATPNWGDPNYTPIAPAGDPDALGGLGTGGVTLELGSLYVGEPNKPADSGTLCKVTASGACTLTVNVNASRGSVVLEDASPATTNLPQSIVLVTDCFPSALTAQYNMWVTLGKPPCWCAAPFGSGYQCDGDADGITSGAPFFYRIYTGDLNAVVTNWKKKATDVTLNKCADIDHANSGAPFFYQVYTNDLNKVVSNWKKKDTALGPCPR